MTALGVYTGPNATGVHGLEAFVDATAAPIDYRLDFLPAGTWAGLKGGIRPTLEAHQAGQPMPLDLTVPLLVGTAKAPGGTLAEVAAGGYDDVWRELGTQAVAHPRDPMTFRIGHEPNGNWYPWSCYDDPGTYVAAWRRVATIIRDTPGTDHVRLSWCVANGRTSSCPRPDLTFPGADLTDELALDWYPYRYRFAEDRYRLGDEATRKAIRDLVWTEQTAGDLKGSDYWADYWRRLADDLGLPFAIGEWAPAIKTNGEGSGDDPDYVHRVLTWCETAGVTRAGFFEGYTSAGQVDHRISNPDTAMPNAARAFRDRMSARVLQVPTSARTPRWAAA